MVTKTRATDDTLGQLHVELAKTLLARVKSNDCTPADLGAAIKFLQANGIEALAVPESPLSKLLDSLPSFDDDEAAVEGKPN